MNQSELELSYLSDKSQQTQTAQWSNQNSKQTRVNGVKRGKSEIGWEASASFFDHDRTA